MCQPTGWPQNGRKSLILREQAVKLSTLHFNDAITSQLCEAEVPPNALLPGRPRWGVKRLTSGRFAPNMRAP